VTFFRVHKTDTDTKDHLHITPRKRKKKCEKRFFLYFSFYISLKANAPFFSRFVFMEKQMLHPYYYRARMHMTSGVSYKKKKSMSIYTFALFLLRAFLKAIEVAFFI